MALRRKLTPLKQWLLWLVVFMITSLAIMCVLFDEDRNHGTNVICEIPDLNPWDASVKKYLPSKADKVRCPKAHNFMFVNDSGFILYNVSVLDFYSLSIKSLRCTYQPVIRLLGDKAVKFGPKRDLHPPVFVNSNVFRITCSTINKLVYDFLHLNPFWIENETRENEIGTEDDDHYSILLIGIDSVSRSHALRNLPKSYKYLTETLGAYDFKGYMRVGSNTFPNLIPLLTGKRHGKFPWVINRLSYCDSLPLLWNEPSLKHYASVYSEDRSDISTFNFVKPGFYRSPTDFYYRPYNMAMNLFTPTIMNPISTQEKNCPWECPCYANKDNFTIQVDHFKGFLNRYKRKLKFSFFWANAAHESFSLLRYSDDTLLALLKWMHVNRHMDRAIVAVVSDHGLRLGDFSATHVGRLERNFPFLSLVVPVKLKTKYPWIMKNLLHNSDQITTAFDVHKTILDIAKAKFGETSSPVRKTRVPRNIFSFIPESRTCADAGIPPNFCICERDDNILSNNDTIVKALATYAVNELNSALANVSNICKTLTLQDVTEAKVQYTCSESLSKKRKWNLGFLNTFLEFSFGYDSEDCDKGGRYKLLFHTLPNKGLFEVMIEYNDKIGDKDMNQMSVIGDVARIDRYGNQSHCIQRDALLRQYCYCKQL